MQLFISHSSDDGETAVAVQRALGRLGHESSFLDIDSTGGLRAGDAWRDVLFDRLARCGAVVFVGSENAGRSRWVHTELALARWLRIPIVPLSFDGTDPHEVVADLHAVRVAQDDDLTAVLRSALAAIGLRAEAAWDPTRSPFPGLRAFSEDEAAVFFGRAESIEELRRLVDPPGRRGHGLVVPVLGPSGSGKSSLVRAGFVSRLRKDPTWVIVEPFTPRDAPLDELSVAVHRSALARGVAIPVDECRELMLAPNGLSGLRRRLLASGACPPDARTLLVIDQGEELVTTTPEARREEFLDAIARNCEPPSDLVVVVTARTDLWDRVDTGSLQKFTSTTVLRVPPLGRAEMVRVIEEPARLARIDFESGLVERLVDDTGSGLALPFLAFVLSKMVAETDRVGGRLVLTHAAYEATGGVQGGIALQARGVVAGTRDETSLAASVLPLVSLTGPDATVRRARASDLTETQRSDLDRLVAARLVVAEGDGPERVYAATHDALLSAWEPLAQLIQSRQDDLRLRDRLSRQATDWDEGDRGRSGLLGGAALSAAIDWTERSGDLVSPVVASFVDQSRLRARRARRARLAAVAVVAALALALGAVLVDGARDAERRASAARAAELIAISERAAESDPVLAAQALIEAYDVVPSVDGFDDNATALLSGAARDAWSADDPVGVLGFAAGGEIGVSFGAAGAKVWHLPTGRVLHEIADTVEGAIRPDGRVVAVTRADSVELFDVDPDAPAPISLASVSGSRPAFSADGTRLGVRSLDRVTLTIWNVSNPMSPAQEMTWRAGGPPVYALAFGADGGVLTLSEDLALRSWDVAGNLIVEVAGVLNAPVTSSAPFAGHLGSGGTGEVVYASGTGLGEIGAVVDLRTETVRRRVAPRSPGLLGALAGSASTWSSAFDQGGTFFVTFDLSNNGQVLDLATDEILTELSGHRGIVTRTSVVDDSVIVSVGLDNTIRVWEAQPAPVPTDRDRLRAALCEVFGVRMGARDVDERLGRDVVGDDPCGVAAADPVVADLRLPGAAAERAVTSTSASAFADDFSSVVQDRWPEGTNEDAQGSQRFGIADGAYEHSLNLGVDGWTYWLTTPAPRVAGSFRVGADARRASGDGGCGISILASESVVTVVAEPSVGVVAIDVWEARQEGGFGPVQFGRVPVPLGDAFELDVHVADTIATVIVDGLDIASIRLPRSIDLQQVGIASRGGVVSCRYDDYHVNTR